MVAIRQSPPDGPRLLEDEGDITGVLSLIISRACACLWRLSSAVLLPNLRLVTFNRVQREFELAFRLSESDKL